jgi:hypothetical protein
MHYFGMDIQVSHINYHTMACDTAITVYGFYEEESYVCDTSVEDAAELGYN